MSIKKTPICPFCKSEMKRDVDHRLYNGVTLPTETKYIQPSPSPSDIKGITDSVQLNLYVCDGCRFVALWKGEP